MANYFENKVTLRHKDPAMIKRAKDAFLANRLFAEFLLDNSEYGDGQHDVGGEVVYSTANKLEINFQSRWEPPLLAYANLSKQGFGIDAYYNEGGSAFCGNWTTEGINEQYHYGDMTVDEIREKVPAEIDIRFVISDTLEEDLKWNESFTQPEEN